MKSKNFKKYAIIGCSAALLAVFAAEPALATFDLEKGVKAGTDPLIAIITKYYGVGLGIGGVGGALVGQGDLRTRGVNAGIGVAIAGGVILAILKAIT